MSTNRSQVSTRRRSTPLPASALRTGLHVAEIKQSFVDSMLCSLGRVPSAATPNDLYTALALAVRDRVLKRGVQTLETYDEQAARVVAYISAEYLPGPHLTSNLLNLGILEEARQAIAELGGDLDSIVDQEEEPGLGNGGLGRLASCFMDSLATLEIPAVGYGLRYEFGIFDQTIRDGWQIETTDKWLRFGNPWEIARPELVYQVRLGGRTEPWTDEQGRYRVRWIPERVVQGMAYDTPILGYRVGTANRMRLWKAEAVESFDFAAFNHGDYYRAVHDKVFSESITKVLYPNDEPVGGKYLRLEQQYLLVTCTLQDMLRLQLLLGRPVEKFHEKWTVQLNDTHPALAIAEFMRLLVDELLVDWDTAWDVTRKTFAYTNHTLLPEALEKWPVPLFARVLPRHLEIVYEINRRFLDEVGTRFPNDEARRTRLSLIDETGPRYVRMAHLAAVGSHRINGVARMHSELLKQTVLRDFAEISPEKFCNVTNGITPRRFLAVANPTLTQLITEQIGDGWLKDLDRLQALEPLADSAAFRARWREVKLGAKQRLAHSIANRTGVIVDSASLFDVQAKRIHEYKRQHLNVLHILALYLRMRSNPQLDIPPRTFIFAGKAAPGYFMAKLIIRLITAVAEVINADLAVRDRLKVVFYPDLNVKNAQDIYPAADLSEQISTAGKEASGTGNMKFALNGALTIGTLDGANVEIREAIGPENFFLFGLTAPEVLDRQSGRVQPFEYYERNEELRTVIDFLRSGALTQGDTRLFQPIVDNLLWNDPFQVLADYQAYAEAQEQVSLRWRDPDVWTRQSILTVARMGRFSSDRAIHEYCEQIWHVRPISMRDHS